jgi:hypothetical protein
MPLVEMVLKLVREISLLMPSTEASSAQAHSKRSRVANSLTVLWMLNGPTGICGASAMRVVDQDGKPEFGPLLFKHSLVARLLKVLRMKCASVRSSHALLTALSQLGLKMGNAVLLAEVVTRKKCAQSYRLPHMPASHVLLNSRGL